MITRIVKLTIEPDKVSDFIQIFNTKKHKISTYEGCKKLNLLYDIKKPNVVYTISEWDTETHLQTYLDSGFFDNTWITVKKLFSAKPEAWSLLTVIA